MDKSINLDNGVRSANHIDLTFMMLPDFGGGQVILDGKVIQDNGNFTDPKLNVLNTAT